MKRYFLLAIFSFTICFNGISQYFWQNQNTSVSNILLDITFLNNNVGYCVGNNGTVLSTSTGGAFWELKPAVPLISSIPQSDLLVGVEVVSENKLIVAANGEKIYASDDAGDTWSISYSTSTNNDLTSTDQSNGRIFVGGTSEIFYTDNAGASWDSVTVTGIGGNVRSIDFEGNHGYICGVSAALGYSGDFGASWTLLSGYPTSQPFNDVFTFSASKCFAVGDGGTIIYTADGGGTWNTVSSGTTADLRSIDFLDNQVGFIAGTGGVLLETDDGGLTWSLNNNHTMTQNILNIEMVTGNVGFFCGSGGQVYRTPTGGGIADISVSAYEGPDTVCAGVPFEIELSFENLGPGYIENPEFKFNPTLLAPTVQFPYVASKMGNTEIAILYGKRIIRDFVSYSFSAGLSNNNFQSKYRDENNQIYKYNKVHYGFSYEINIKWFNSKKERYRIYMLVPVGKPTSFGRSIGFKLLGNISNHSYLGFAVTYGFGYHKKL